MLAGYSHSVLILCVIGELSVGFIRGRSFSQGRRAYPGEQSRGGTMFTAPLYHQIQEFSLFDVPA